MSKSLLNPSASFATPTGGRLSACLHSPFSPKFPLNLPRNFWLSGLKSLTGTTKCVANVQPVPKQDLSGDNGMNGLYESEFNVQAYELDQFGMVNNAVYLRYCQRGRDELLKRIWVDADQFAASGGALAVAELSLKFLGPLMCGDRFVLKVRVIASSGARLFMEHLIFKLPNGEPVLEAKDKCVFIDKDFRPLRVPADVRKAVRSG